MRDTIPKEKTSLADIYGLDGWLYYEFPYCFSPKSLQWHEITQSFMESDRDTFCEKKCAPFRIATPEEGVVQADGKVLPWFSPEHAASLPPYVDRTWFIPTMDAVIDQAEASDQRTVFYGRYDEPSQTFFFNLYSDDYIDSNKILLIFQNTIFSPVFQVFADRVDGQHMVNINNIATGRVDEFILADAEKLQEVTKVKYGNVAKRLYDNIGQYDVLRERDSKYVAPDTELVNVTKELLDKIRLVSDELTSINPRIGFDIIDTPKQFSINGKNYAYTAGAIEYLQRIVEIAHERPLNKMVPQQLGQVRRQMDTCIMHLHQIPKRSGVNN